MSSNGLKATHWSDDWPENGTSADTDAAARIHRHDDISVEDFIQTLVRWKWIILGTFVLVLTAATAYTATRPLEYEATTTVFIEKQQSSQLSEMLGGSAGNRNIKNEVEIIKSRAIARKVARRLRQEGVVPGTGARLSVLGRENDAPSLTELDIANRLRSRYIEVSPLARDVDFVVLKATSTVPEEAALIANAYAEEYVDYNRSSSRARMTASREFLAGVTERFQDDLELAEEDLRLFLDQEALVAPDEEATALIQQISQIQQVQFETQAQLGMVQAQVRELESELDRVVPGIAAQIASGDDVIIDRLIQAIAELEVRVEQKYAKNPALREDPSGDAELSQQLDQIASLREEVSQRAARLVENAVGYSARSELDAAARASTQERLGTLQSLRQEILEKRIEMRGLVARLDIIEGQLSNARGRLNSIPRQEIILNRLERSLTTREQLYVTLVEKLQEARIAEQSELGNVSIIDEAMIPASPVRPKKARNIFLAAVLGLMLGVGVAIGHSATDNKVRTPEDLRKRGYSVIGVVPSMQSAIENDLGGKEHVVLDGQSYASTLITLLNPLSPMAESFRRLRTNLQFARPDSNVRSVLVTSSMPGEGKTVTAMNLAVAMAQSGRRVAYVDADLRRPRGHRMIGVPRDPGVIDLIFQHISFNGVDELKRFATPVDDLYVIPAGAPVPNPSEVVGSNRMREVLAKLQDAFDVIIIDTPPVLAVSDALSISRHADAKLMVCSASEATWPTLERAVDEISSTGVTLTGIVLNRYEERSSYGGYGYGYGEYYGEQAQSAQTTS